MKKHAFNFITPDGAALASLRYLCYIIFVAGTMQLVMLDSKSGAAMFSERSYTELLQSILLLTSTLIMIYVFHFLKTMNNTSIIMATLFFISLIRENDYWLDAYIFDGAWQVMVTLVTLPALFFVIKNRYSFMRETKEINNCFGTGMFAAGFLITYVFSRLYGRSIFWKSMLGENYIRVIKDAAEEITELAGYMLLFFSCIELFLLARQKLKR